jgi:hypothetical protein
MRSRVVGAGGIIINLKGKIEITYAWGLGIPLITKLKHMSSYKACVLLLTPESIL